jgi:protein SCO1
MSDENPPSLPLDQQQPSSWSKWLLRGLYAFGGFWVIVVLAFNIIRPIKVLPRISLAPGFILTNQAGEHKTSEDYRGKITVYNFTYGHCGDGCPQTSAQMAALRESVSQATLQNVKVALVTISLDPARDILPDWKQYAAPYLEKQSSSVPWDFLIGGAKTTKNVVGGGFGVFYEMAPDQNGQYTVQYEPRFVLVDGWGIIRADLQTANLDVSEMLRDIGYLDEEIKNSQGVARYAYEAAHFFKCYH